MAKDDYFVIVYQILSYLYQRLKRGESMDARMISAESDLYTIPYSYWLYIIENLVDDGYILGPKFLRADGKTQVVCLERTKITPKGIQYLFDNSLLEKAKAFFKDAKEIIPYI